LGRSEAPLPRRGKLAERVRVRNRARPAFVGTRATCSSDGSDVACRRHRCLACAYEPACPHTIRLCCRAGTGQGRQSGPDRPKLEPKRSLLRERASSGLPGDSRDRTDRHWNQSGVYSENLNEPYLVCLSSTMVLQYCGSSSGHQTVDEPPKAPFGDHRYICTHAYETATAALPQALSTPVPVIPWR
jgi:hypothetical protein